ncbi:MAG: type II toxin-antitoxin system prevent-host-death family antitoxin [Novosphingobium sp.]|nr:type II toxin-antitoxin system prevent-host-death family antitoxin [Novosphingobium sp.]
MDRAITATEANQRFSEILREVSQGNSFTVTSRGRAVARVVPVEREDQKQKIERLLEYVKTLPPTRVAPWTREELYD